LSAEKEEQEVVTRRMEVQSPAHGSVYAFWTVLDSPKQLQIPRPTKHPTCFSSPDADGVAHSWRSTEKVWADTLAERILAADTGCTGSLHLVLVHVEDKLADSSTCLAVGDVLRMETAVVRHEGRIGRLGKGTRGGRGSDVGGEVDCVAESLALMALDR
jgi:hypothetical protein